MPPPGCAARTWAALRPHTGTPRSPRPGAPRRRAARLVATRHAHGDPEDRAVRLRAHVPRHPRESTTCPRSTPGTRRCSTPTCGWAGRRSALVRDRRPLRRVAERERPLHRVDGAEAAPRRALPGRAVLPAATARASTRPGLHGRRHRRLRTLTCSTTTCTSDCPAAPAWKRSRPTSTTSTRRRDRSVDYFAQITRNTDGTYSSNVADDPRLQDDWDVRARRWSEHPLGIQRLGYATMAVSDVDATRAIFEKLWLAVPVHDGVDEERGVRSSFMQLGHFLRRDRVAAVGRRAARRTRRTVRRHALPAHVPRRRPRRGGGVPPHRRRALRADVATAVVTANPDDCLGANYAFSTETCPGDPLA